MFLISIFILIYIIYKYFIKTNSINNDNLFIIILNIIFLSIYPIYYYYFKDNLYTFLINIILIVLSLLLNIKTKEVSNSKILPIIYLLINILMIFML